MFDESTLPCVNIQEQQSNNFKILIESNSYFLYENENRWMVAGEDNRSIYKEMYACYDMAYGKILLTGLGFGMLAMWLSEKKSVESVTVVEKNKEIIDFFNKYNFNKKINIILDDANFYKSDIEYDCVFLDHYELETSDYIIDNVKNFLSRVNYKKIWFWPIERIFINKTYDTRMKHMTKNNFVVLNDSEDNIFERWNIFIKQYFPKQYFFYDIKKKDLIDYIYTAFDKDYILKEKGFYDGK
jgi:hypothetical protein